MKSIRLVNKSGYDSKRVGPINKKALVSSNAIIDSQVYVEVKGEIILKRTTISVEPNNVDVGTVLFGEDKHISFIVSNTKTVAIPPARTSHFLIFDFFRSFFKKKFIFSSILG